ncbi:class I SAM-dependent methyltransferase [Kitasatospora sp. NPDC059722]|uniref:class I SAM-dependent methyltransferase n=1 Tax=unclassified Kitasatospora TaxID=2633591 RepID=UPI00365EF5A2
MVWPCPPITTTTTIDFFCARSRPAATPCWTFGCGTGRFARRLAGLGFEVDAVDPSEQAVVAARASSAPAASEQQPQFRHADIAQAELPKGYYDFISCRASSHHLPFGTVRALRDALAPAAPRHPGLLSGEDTD